MERQMLVNDRLALYTTAYPGVEKYLSAWYQSVLGQTDREFDIWVGVDGLTTEKVASAIGADLPATWIIGGQGDSPAQVRQEAMARIADTYSAVVLVDSDDLLEPTRIEAARASLRESDVIGCAMRIIDESGNDLGVELRPPTMNVRALVPQHNVFGLSNTIYRSEVLRRCLPIPAKCALVDWFLSTRAWALGAALGFDFACRMAYRQHAYNIAQVLPPFTPEQVIAAAEKVLDHYALVLGNIPELELQHRSELEAAANRALAFHESAIASSGMLHKYVQALNHLPLNHIWWECVAHHELEDIWKRG